VDASMQNAKQPVTAALAGPYGHPFHAMLVPVPIGAWVISLVFASRVVGDTSALAEGSLWLIGIGVLGALAAATVGFLDFFSLPARTVVRRTAIIHLSLNLTITAAFALNFWWRRDLGTDDVTTGPLVLSALSVAALAVSGFLGGTLAYRYGVRVADEDTQAEGYRPRPTA
jgi:uncharacterized membrane protein